MSEVRFLEAAVGLVGLQCLATLGFVGWLARPDAAPRQRASAPAAASAPVHAPDHQTQERRGPARPPKQKFDDETEATQAYVDQVARAFDLGVLVSEAIDMDELRAALDAARACEQLDCEGLTALVDQAVQTGRPVPPLPAFGDRGSNSEAIAVLQYVHVLRGEVKTAARDAGRPELVPSDELFDAAGDCKQFACDGLDMLLEDLGVAMAALGRSVPPMPELNGP